MSTNPHTCEFTEQLPSTDFSWRLVTFLVISVMMFPGCIETIDFGVERTGGRLTVDGMITDSPGPYTLNLRRTSVEEKISDPLGGALITISDNLGNSEEYYEVSPGTYELAGQSVRGIHGRGYTIEIILPGGSRYRSEMEVMPDTMASDSLFYEFDTVETTNSYGSIIETDVIRINRDTVVPSTDVPLYLKWEVEESYKFTEFDFPDPFNNPPPSCYITDYPEPQTVHLYNGSELAGGRLEVQTLVERKLDHTFYQRHYLNVIQYAITRTAYRYWTQINQIVNQSGTIFDVPPANPHSNIFNVNIPEETVLGYFSAAAVDTSRVFVTNSDLPVYISNPCRSTLGPDCIGGCRRFENSSPDPPFYWLRTTRSN